MSIPAIVIGGTSSGVGKTTVSLALMAGFRNLGYKVQPYKVGPDYIDPSYHQLVCKRPSYNLDVWMLGKDTVQSHFQSTQENAEIAIVEGVMGLFDGASSTTEESSTAQLAKLLKAPVILVLDASALARSVAAMVHGYKTFDPDIQIAGVILNRVGSFGHYEMLRESIERYTKIPVLGGLLRDTRLHIPERHLGLKTASENSEFQESLKALEELARPSDQQPGIDLKKIFEIASDRQGMQMVPGTPCVPGTFSLSVPGTFSFTFSSTGQAGTLRVRIGIAQDKAFSFYYQANLDLLTQLGAELIPFSPLEDKALPENLGALYFGGGFPEIYAKELEGSQSMRASILQAAQQGIPVYAECGGLMYLAEAIENLEGETFGMVGALPGKVKMTQRLQNFGYAEATLARDCFLGKKGDKFRGHEFHYSSWDFPRESAIHEISNRSGASIRSEGLSKENIYTTYIHSHFLSSPERARRFVGAAKNYSESKKQLYIF